MKRIKEFLREILAPRVVIHQYGNMTQQEMNKKIAGMDKVFEKMDEVYKEMDKVFK